MPQRLLRQFPTQINREYLLKIREISSRNRELSSAIRWLGCGFQDHSHLTRVFTRIAGVSPDRPVRLTIDCRFGLKWRKDGCDSEDRTDEKGRQAEETSESVLSKGQEAGQSDFGHNANMDENLLTTLLQSLQKGFCPRIVWPRGRCRIIF